MEKSHASAKSAYQRHTQHGGTKQRISPIVQTFQHWYRIVQHRENEQQHGEPNTTSPASVEADILL